MNKLIITESKKLSIVVPCYNEEKTLERCIERVMKIADESLTLEIIIVDDKSRDESLSVARKLKDIYPEIIIESHSKNQGKGAALRTGFKLATGDYVAVQDADLEYDPKDLKTLLLPLINDDADVVLGSRFLSSGAHRVLYFWHYLGNCFLTLLSNIFTDLNLTDMETCYKVFKREIIQSINIHENRFGFEPEIVAKIAQKRLRIYEMGISYFGRTYEEGKKITAKDGFRALYCIFRYNAHQAALPVQFIIYILIGGFAAIINMIAFLAMHYSGMPVSVSLPTAFMFAAIVNYLLCITVLFKHKVRWNTLSEFTIYIIVIVSVAIIDYFITRQLLYLNMSPFLSKSIATGVGLIFNFLGRRYFVFPKVESNSSRI